MKDEYDILGEIDKLINDMEKFHKDVCNKLDEATREVANNSLNKARREFAMASYDGINDVTVSAVPDGANVISIEATSGQPESVVLFIEYGTGINYPDNHPEKPAEVTDRGQYGHKLGRLSQWRYPAGAPGTNGVADPNHPGYYITRGNKANMCMYKARELAKSNASINLVKRKLQEAIDK